MGDLVAKAGLIAFTGEDREQALRLWTRRGKRVFDSAGDWIKLGIDMSLSIGLWYQSHKALLSRTMQTSDIAKGADASRGENAISLKHSDRHEAAVRELIRQGTEPSSILVIDPDQRRIDLATDLGATGLAADATLRTTLEAAAANRCATILVSPGRDDTAALIVLSARQINPQVPISVSVRAVDNEELLHQAGATTVINPVTFGGHLLARAASHREAVEYLQDLVSAEGRVVIEERVAGPEDIGKTIGDLRTGMGVRLVRADQIVDAPKENRAMIAEGDRLVEIVCVKR